MKPTLCSRCKKNLAVIFITKIDGGKTVNEGLCLKCAKEMGIKPVDDMIERMGLSEDDLENLNGEMTEAMNGLEGLLGQNQSDDDEADENDSQTATFPFLNKLFGAAGQDNVPAAPEPEKTESRQRAAEKPNGSKNKKHKFLDTYCQNLTQKARDGKLDHIIGREEELERVIQILNRRQKNNPCLIGEPGVGKTAIAEGLAQKIAAKDVPYKLQNKEVYLMDLTALVAGTQFRGQFESRMKGLIEEVKKLGNIILVIDEVHNLVGAGDAEGSMNAANILKPALSRGEIQVIGATTFNEYRKYIEKDAALERRFQPVTVAEPTIEQSIAIIRGISHYYEAFHGVVITPEIARQAVLLSERYITDRFLPDKAIDLIDEAASKLRLERDSMPQALDEAARAIMQLEIEREAIKREGDEYKLKEIDEKLSNLRETEKSLRAKWMAEKTEIEKIQKNKQDIEQLNFEAQKAQSEGNYARVAEIRYSLIKQKEDENQEIQKRLHELQGDGAMIKEEVDAEDIAEIVSHWTGIPVKKMAQSEKEKLLHLEEELHRRVVGQDDAIKAVSDAVRRSRAGLNDPRRPIGSFIFLGTTGVGKTELAKALAEYLFDDEDMMTRIDMSEYMEKHSVSRLVGAPPGYVGYEEGGQLTEAVRRKPYSVVLFDEIEKANPDVFNILLQVLDDGRLTDNKGRFINFKNTIIIMTSNMGSPLIRENFANMTDENRQETIERTKQDVIEMLKQNIRPEFLNRIDEIVMFEPLNRRDIQKIVDIQVNSVRKILAGNGVTLNITKAAEELLADDGYDPEFGARPVKRTIQRLVLNQLSKDILAGQVDREHPITIDRDGDRLVFKN